MTYIQIPEPPRMSRPPRPTWKSLMAHSGTLPMFQQAINAMWAAEKAIASRDAPALDRAGAKANEIAGEIERQKRLPGALLALIYRRAHAINEDIVAWRSENEGVK